MNNNLAKERVYWIDNAKAYGIILVIYGHFVLYTTTAAATIQAKLIYSFHMPLFFILCGYFARDGVTLNRAYLFDRFIKRIMPAFIFNILGLAISFSWNLFNNTMHTQQYLYGLLNMLRGTTVYSLTAWFLVCLFMVEIIHAVVCRFVKTKMQLLISIILFLCLGLLLNEKFSWIKPIAIFSKKAWYINAAIIAYIFYQIGIMLRPLLSKLAKAPKVYILLSLCLMLVVLLLTFDMNSGMVLMIASSYGIFPLFVISALAGSFFIILLALLTPLSRPVLFIGQSALILMLLDGLLRPIGRRIFSWVSWHFGLDNQFSVFIAGIIITAVFAASWLYIIAILRRFIPERAKVLIGLSPLIQ